MFIRLPSYTYFRRGEGRVGAENARIAWRTPLPKGMNTSAGRPGRMRPALRSQFLLEMGEGHHTIRVNPATTVRPILEAGKILLQIIFFLK